MSVTIGRRAFAVNWWWASKQSMKGGNRAMTIEISMAILLSIVSLCISSYLGFKSNKRYDTQAVADRAASDARINLKLDNINVIVSDVKKDVTSMRSDIASHNERLIKVEASVKSAHHRLDHLEECVDKHKEV